MSVKYRVMTARAPQRRSTELVVLATDAGRLFRWLSDPAQRAAALVAPGRDEPMAGFPSGILGTPNVGGSGWDCLRVPLDGPVEALALAMHALRQHAGSRAPQTCVVIEQTPAPPVLCAVSRAGLMPGIDLTRLSWAQPHLVWLSAASGVAALPYDLTSPGHGQALAAAIGACDLVPAASPLGAWTSEVATGATDPTLQTWASALAALYVESCVTALQRCA